MTLAFMLEVQRAVLQAREHPHGRAYSDVVTRKSFPDWQAKYWARQNRDFTAEPSLL